MRVLDSQRILVFILELLEAFAGHILPFQPAQGAQLKLNGKVVKRVYLQHDLGQIKCQLEMLGIKGPGHFRLQPLGQHLFKAVLKAIDPGVLHTGQ